MESAVTYRRPEAGSGQVPEVTQGSVEEAGEVPETDNCFWTAQEPTVGQKEVWNTEKPAPHRWNSHGDSQTCADRASRRLVPAPVQPRTSNSAPALIGSENTHRSSEPILNVPHPSRTFCEPHGAPTHPQEHRPATPHHSLANQPPQEVKRPAPVWEEQRRPPAVGPYHRISIQRRQKGFGLSLAWTCPPR